MTKWKIINLEYLIKDGKKVVKNIYWIAEASDIFGHGVIWGNNQIDTSNSDVEALTFVNFERLKHDKVLGWLHSALGEGMIQEIEQAALKMRQENKQLGGTGTPVNWVS